MSVRTALIAAAVGTLALASVSSSQAADLGHSAAQQAMNAQVRSGAAPGVLGSARDGAGPWHGTAGHAAQGRRRPRMPRDRFRIGSLTKPFVACVLLQLEAQHKIDLDAPAARYLPAEVRDEGGGLPGVTVRRLLQHTSGIPDFTALPAYQRAYFTPRFLHTRYATRSAAQLAAPALARPRTAAPGTRWSYSNTNYVLAGMVIQQVTGHSYGWEIAHRILGPLHLRATSLPGTRTALPAPHGRAYSALGPTAGSRRPRRVYDVTSLNPTLAGAAGSMVSTTGDLTRFLRALLSGRVLPARQLAEMERTAPAGDGDRYGLGLTEQRLPCGTTVWGHEGVIQGSLSIAAATAGGAHAAAFNLNGDWADRAPAKLLDAEFCGQ